MNTRFIKNAYGTFKEKARMALTHIKNNAQKAEKIEPPPEQDPFPKTQVEDIIFAEKMLHNRYPEITTVPENHWWNGFFQWHWLKKRRKK